MRVAAAHHPLFGQLVAVVRRKQHVGDLTYVVARPILALLGGAASDEVFAGFQRLDEAGAAALALALVAALTTVKKGLMKL